MKKIMKKIAAAVVAGGVSLGMITTNAYASTGLLGDVNGDGYITAVDASILTQYLRGNCEITNSGSADTNRDLVISKEDIRMLNKHIAGTVILPNVNHDITVSNMGIRRYFAYNYATNDIESYSLTVRSVTTFASGTEDEDDRVRDTDTSVVQITPSGGTGFIVGDHVIATAAHCVYSHSTSDFVEDIEIVVRGVPYGSGSAEIDRFTAVETHVPATFIEATNTDVREMYDYALIYVEEDLSQYGIFDLGVPSDEFMSTEASVTLSGFPSETASNPSAQNQGLYKDTGVVLDIGELANDLLDYQLITNAYASGGDSGGPIYMTTTIDDIEYRTVIGVFTSVGNMDYDNDDAAEHVSYGTRITSALLRFYCNNEYIGTTLS